MKKKSAQHVRGHGFGTAPVFLAAISRILGAILFLRFGYAVGDFFKKFGNVKDILFVRAGYCTQTKTGGEPA